MITLKKYKYNYNQDPEPKTYIAEIKARYKDGEEKRGYKDYLLFKHEQDLNKIFAKIDNLILLKNSGLESWEFRIFLHKLKLTSGISVKRPVEKKIKRRPRKKFQTIKEFNPKSKFNAAARRLLKASSKL